MAEPSVFIAGAGPTGLAAALFLSREGIPVRIVDQADAKEPTSRALAVNPRSLELLEGTGVTERMVAEGRPIKRVRFYQGWSPLAELDFRDIHPRYGMIVLPQSRSEALLTEALAQAGVTPERSVRLDGLIQTEQCVQARLTHADGRDERAQADILFGADGAHSETRRCLGLGFEGTAFPEPWPLRDVYLDVPLDTDSAHVSFSEDGLTFLLALEPGLWRVFGNVPDPIRCLPYGTRIGVTQWDSTFHISHRVASTAAVGRVALGGDAAHIHSPAGARGMNLGIEDAFVFASYAIDTLSGDSSRLADYGRSRHQVHRKVVRRIELLTRLARGRPPPIRTLRRFLIPFMAGVSATAAAMRRTLTGLDHEVEVA
jgi:2-polyprenyl-6-methoxyphenol hydroxylase-like FAD-dependent oxidoreductase